MVFNYSRATTEGVSGTLLLLRHAGWAKRARIYRTAPPPLAERNGKQARQPSGSVSADLGAERSDEPVTS